PRKRREDARLFGIVAHEKLAYAEAVGGDPPDAYQKRAGACSTRKARSFGIEKRPFSRWYFRYRAFRKEREQVVWKIGESPDIGTSMLMMGLKQPLRLEVFADGGLNLFAHQRIFDVTPRARNVSLQCGCGCGGRSVARIHTSDPFAQRFQLFPQLAH